MGKSESTNLFQTISQSPRWSRVISFSFGIILVAFFGFLGLGIESTTEVLDFSSSFISVVQAASVGLGMGYYLGASLKGRNGSRQWILLGIFTGLTIWGILILNTQLFWRIPTFTLIPLGGVLSIFAHLTPAVQNEKKYRELFRFISGLLTTIIVVFLRVAELLATLVVDLISWITSTTPTFIIALVAIFVALFVGFVLGIWAEEQDNQ
ncbi:hypothetical protein SAMN06266787_10612 [Halorubrum ezzemoulense]|uniref:Uncharacterized protein n=1 Tax=Halorubrum ezzemoulense TaxID=337243 RepID=A0A238XPJ8_HALEZ|nr:hypothetical protein [Halorubrum ezzemoulense]SNR60471.1 hypothetical protein SAMN06266787_10612 [Halorubrum ezzemoulense]